MQHVHVDEYEAYEEGPSRLARAGRVLSTAIGAAVALALLLGVGVWFYRLGVRDAANVPIIRASAEPAKTRPADPGGAVAPHQEIASYRVAESRPAQASAVVLAPPPPQPRREDVAMGTLAPEPAGRPAPIAATEPVAPAAPPELAAAKPDTAALAAVRAEEPAVPAVEAATPAEPPAAPETPVKPDGAEVALGAPAAAAPEAGAEPATAPVADPVPGASEYAPPASPVAPPRPDDLRAEIDAAVAEARQSEDRLARRAAESDIQIQLAADPDEGVIRAMWDRISRSNADILRDKELAVQTTVSGGTTFYRLRVGPFGALSEARAVCQALKARGQDCITARNG